MLIKIVVLLFIIIIRTLTFSDMLHIHTGHQPAAGIYVVEPAYLGL